MLHTAASAIKDEIAVIHAQLLEIFEQVKEETRKSY
jgi:hypothetical protein